MLGKRRLNYVFTVLKILHSRSHTFLFSTIISLHPFTSTQKAKDARNIEFTRFQFALYKHSRRWFLSVYHTSHLAFRPRQKSISHPIRPYSQEYVEIAKGIFDRDLVTISFANAGWDVSFFWQQIARQLVRNRIVHAFVRMLLRKSGKFLVEDMYLDRRFAILFEEADCIKICHIA